MAEINPRRWSVTYTKHLKQKRKVYHDGFLELNASGDKVRLYDESENLIESKFLSKAESVECGKSFTMDSHLVDIADPIHLASSSTPTPLAQPKGNKSNSFQRKPLHKVSHLMQSNNKEARKNAEPWTIGVLSSNSTPLRSLIEEWSVLYTTQLTQKAKKYHDGMLRLSQLGSHAKQMVLYDENERLLESKVLGKDDAVESGQTLIMQAHLVDIGLSTLQVGKDNNKISSLKKPFQKITLASEEGQILGSRYLKSFECVESGRECELPGYLVQVYDLRVSQEGSDQRSPLKQFVKSKTLVKSISAKNDADERTKKVQVKNMNAQTGSSTEMENSTNNHGTKEQVENMNTQTGSSTEIEKSTNRCAGSNQRSPLEQFVKSKTLVKSTPAKNGADDGIKKEQVENMKTQTGSSTGMEKSISSKNCISVARRDACQIMSVLKKPIAVPERDVARVGKEAHLSLYDEILSAQGMLHDKDGNAHHCPLTSSSMEIGSKDSEEVQIMVNDNCTSSATHNSSSGLSATTVSASCGSRYADVILQENLEMGGERVGSVQASFDGPDNCFDLPSFDLGF